jgi:Bacterial TSP3 repeat
MINSERTSISEKILVSLSLIALFIFLSGTKACQEDYELGNQSNAGTTTPTGTATDEDSGTVTLTPTATTGVTETATANPTAEVTATPTSETAQVVAQGFLTELSNLDEDKKHKSQNTNKADSSVSSKGGSANWLGRAYLGGSSERDNLDSDGDGFADWLETEEGSSPNESASTPPAPKIKLSRRMESIDSDYDGASNSKESNLLTDPDNADSDSDGVLDGLEFLANSNPLDSTSVPIDADGDGLSDSVETSRGLNKNQSDTDGDGISDALEVILHCDPLEPDTDGDGIFDGKEYAIGSDPALSERE